MPTEAVLNIRRPVTPALQSLLFDEIPVGPPRFPQAQFLGNKERLLEWIFSVIPPSSPPAPLRFLDAFSGSGIVAFEAKRRNYEVVANDLLQCCWNVANGMVENGSSTLSRDEADALFLPAGKRGELMVRLFADRFFRLDEARLLDDFRSNVELLDTGRRTLAMTVMQRALTRKVIMGHFAHCQALSYAQNPLRVRRNPSIARPVQDLFMELLPQYNDAVFDNGLRHRAYHGDVLELLKKDSAFDVAYFDPPYCMSHSDYQAFYHLLETFSRYWADKEFRGGTNRYWPPLPSGFDKKSEVEKTFHMLFDLARAIPLWIISYNDRSYPGEALFESWLQGTGREVAVHRSRYQNGRGGKGSVKGSHEMLFVARLA